MRFQLIVLFSLIVFFAGFVYYVGNRVSEKISEKIRVNAPIEKVEASPISEKCTLKPKAKQSVLSQKTKIKKAKTFEQRYSRKFKRKEKRDFGWVFEGH